MSAPRTIPSDVRRVQVQAADPDISAFVSANAGSGKTHVLAQRVINLLLRGCDPAKILCITFTKAAAANMANRVFDTLAQWTALDDAALDERIMLFTGRKPGASERARARRLFASALETPGGLKVQTIHAFCTRLLHQFPFEANVAARFAVLDEASTTQLLDQLTLDVLLEASAAPESALGKALAIAIVMAADQTFKDVIGDAIREREVLGKWLAHAGSIDAALADLSRILGIDTSDTIDTLEDEFFSASHIPAAEWSALIEVFASGSTNDKKHIATLEAARLTNGRERIEHYLRVFCTGELEPRKNIVTKAIAERHPNWLMRLEAEQERVCALLARERAIHARGRTRALITIAAEVIARYKRAKEQRALLDYDDLIEKTLELFKRSSAAWVLYKLDLGIDHVLIDEAQDTSPKQWEIIRTICSEFIPGGARSETKRTVFAVGDEKQSIFSFQGAEPHAFYESRKYFEKLFRDAALEFAEKKFEVSFRSGEVILNAVDIVYSRPEAFEGLSADPVKTVHRALPDAAPGLVELWKPIEPADKPDMEGWDAPFDTQSEESPRAKLARKIAAYVKRQTANGLKAGDVLILVRQRGPLFEAIIRALKDSGVPVAGADRLVLTEHIAVMDLMALADCLLLPNDDLALASILKSPLFGMNEEQLFALAWDRKDSLRKALRTKSDESPCFAAAERALAQLTQAARQLKPFEFFAHVLGPLRGRQKFLQRLGPEANDALDEFLNLALDYEQRETPSLQGFVAWLRAAKSEVRRDMEMARDEVRVMTVHGAKGLEANTVILADTMTPPTGPRDPRLLHLNDAMLVWATARAEDVGVMSEARETLRREVRDEYRRLLYVAMTRAAERLIVCGAQGAKKMPDGCWYQLINDALSEHCVAEAADDGDGEVLRYRKHAPEIGSNSSSIETTDKSVKLIPAWLTQTAPEEAPAIRTISPSNLDEDTARPAASGGASAALKRGLLAHRLMQSLPDIPSERRAQAAADYLAHAGKDLGPEECAKLTEQVVRVIDDKRFQALYAPGSRAEVSIVGKLMLGGKEVRVSGQVDRLVMTEGQVLIADFKTNRPPPRRIEDIPPAYVRQLTLYRAVLAKLYPARTVRAALVWTEAPDFVELSADVLDAAMAQLSRS